MTMEIKMEKLEEIRQWRLGLSVEPVNEGYSYANSQADLVLENIDWLISELARAEASRKKIMKSLGCL